MDRVAQRKRRKELALAGAVIGVAALFTVSTMIPAWGRRGSNELKKTRAQAGNARGALNQFEANYRRWPTALSELTNNTDGIVFFAGPLVDGWGRGLVYEAPDGTNAGRVGSFGKDGKPGGSGADADFFEVVKIR